ncbi:hypothetical protein [Roseovarius sp. D0-M9]|uniref:hypothetical protein n=1 Tax=Roseovarius sp. D0-M9 TaxID=3127117 RepID=UPI00300F813F
MSALFEELDYCPTPIGALSLRRRRDMRLGVDVVVGGLGLGYTTEAVLDQPDAAELCVVRSLARAEEE